MRKVVPPKLVWKYVGDESPEKRRESEERVKQVYDRIFSIARINILARRKTKYKSEEKDDQSFIKGKDFPGSKSLK